MSWVNITNAESFAYQNPNHRTTAMIQKIIKEGKRNMASQLLREEGSGYDRCLEAGPPRVLQVFNVRSVVPVQHSFT